MAKSACRVRSDTVWLGVLVISILPVLLILQLVVLAYVPALMFTTPGSFGYSRIYVLGTAVSFGI